MIMSCPFCQKEFSYCYTLKEYIQYECKPCSATYHVSNDKSYSLEFRIKKEDHPYYDIEYFFDNLMIKIIRWKKASEKVCIPDKNLSLEYESGVYKFTPTNAVKKIEKLLNYY